MNEIKECLDRLFEGKLPLNKNWKATLGKDHEEDETLIFLHYQKNLVMVYSLTNHRILYERFNSKTELLGLWEAKNYLINKYGKFNE